jgi:hypothetical protein
MVVNSLSIDKKYLTIRRSWSRCGLFWEEMRALLELRSR